MRSIPAISIAVLLLTGCASVKYALAVIVFVRGQPDDLAVVDAVLARFQFLVRVFRVAQSVAPPFPRG